MRVGLFFDVGDFEPWFVYKTIIENRKSVFFGMLSYLSNHLRTWYVVRSKHGEFLEWHSTDVGRKFGTLRFDDDTRLQGL